MWQDSAGMKWQQSSDSIPLRMSIWTRRAQSSAPAPHCLAPGDNSPLERISKRQKAKMGIQGPLQLNRNTVLKVLLVLPRNHSPCMAESTWRQIFMVISVFLRPSLSILPSAVALGGTVTIPSFRRQNESSPAPTVPSLLCLGSWQRNSSSSLISSVYLHLIPHKTRVLTAKAQLLAIHLWTTGIDTLQRVWGKSLAFLHQFLYLWSKGSKIYTIWKVLSIVWEYQLHITINKKYLLSMSRLFSNYSILLLMGCNDIYSLECTLFQRWDPLYFMQHLPFIFKK